MKFQFYQTVILLDTEYKPAGNAVVCDYNDDLHQYEVNYKYPSSENSEKFWVREERLMNAENSEGH